MVVDSIGGAALGCCPGTGLGFPVGVSKIKMNKNKYFFPVYVLIKISKCALM